MKQYAISKGLSAWMLKLTALAAMLIDHLAWVFLPQDSWQGILSHTLGAMAMPVFSFFIAEGYAHTRSVSAYAKRLGLSLIAAGHYATEFPVTAAVAAKLRAALPELEVLVSTENRDPYTYL